MRWHRYLALLVGCTLTGLTAHANAAPGVPTNLSVTSGNASAALKWDAPGGSPTDYDYEYRRVDGGTWTEYDPTNTSTALTKTITGLINGKTYRFRVRAGNDTGDSTWSWPLVELMIGLPPKPSTPSVTAGNTQVSLSASVTSNNGSAITKWRYIKKAGDNAWETDWTDISSSNANSLSTTITGLTNNTAYRFKVLAVNGNGEGPESASAQVTPSDTAPTLTAENIKNSSATLKISNHTGNWYYKYTVPSGGTCSTNAVSGTSTNLTGLTGNTSYTYKAYSNSDCTTGLTTDVEFLTTPNKATVIYIGEGSGEIRVWWQTPLGGTKVRIQRKLSDQNWSDGFTTTVPAAPGKITLTNATNGKEYNIRLSFRNATGWGPWSRVLNGTPGLPAFTASAVTQSGATLTLDKYDGWNTHAATNWSYKYTSPTGGQCTNVAKASGRTVTVTGLNSGTSYTYKAYKNSGCSTELATALSFTTLSPTLTPSNITYNTAKLEISNHSGDWYYQYTSPTGGTCSSTAVTTSSVNLSNLDSGTSYTYKAYENSGCSTELTTDATDAEFVTQPGKVSNVQASRGNGTLSLRWDSETGATGYKVQWKSATDSGWDASNRQTTASSTTTTLSNLTNGTEYSIRVAGTNGSGSGPWSSTITGTPSTKPPAPNKPDVAARDQAVVLSWTSNGNGGSPITSWKYLKKEGGNNWETATPITGSGASTTSYTVTGLTNGEVYRFKVLAVNVNGDGSPSPESDPATPGSVTLNAKSIKGTKATLEINGHSNDWYYKKTAPSPAGSCSSNAISGTTTDLTSLTASTKYTYKAYATAGCTDAALATVEFTTKNVPKQPTTFTASAGNAEVTLKWTSGGDGGSSITKWQYTKDNGTRWHPICETSTNPNCPSITSYRVTALSNGTTYTFQVRAVNAIDDINANGAPGGAGPASAEATATPRAVSAESNTGQQQQSSSDPNETAETLTASDATHNAVTLTMVNWSSVWYYEHPVTGKCTEVEEGTSSVSVRGLTSGSAYTFTAYSDSGCTTEIATASTVTMLLAGVTVSPTRLTLEEKGGKGTYTLVLEREPLGDVTIRPLSDDDTVATVSPTVLRFTAENWTTPQPVTVKGVDDEETNDPGRTTTISHTINGGGYDKASVEDVEVTLIDDDTIGKRLDEVILPKVVGQVTAATTTAITTRLDAIAGGEEAGPVDLEEVTREAVEFLQSHEEALNGGGMKWEEALSGRRFAVPLSSLWLSDVEEDVEKTVASAPEGPVVLWGRGDYTSYGDSVKGIEFDGNSFLVHVGFDLEPRVDVVTGVALALSSSRFDYTDTTKTGSMGTYKVRITSVNPYMGYTASEQLRLWVSVGYGRGEREIKPDGEATMTDNSEWRSVIGGARFELWSTGASVEGESAPFSLAMKVDGVSAQFLEVRVQQARLAAEASRRFAVASGELTTAVELGLRLRSEEAAGVELGGRLHWQDTARGLSSTINGRLLLAGGDAREWGVGGNVSYGPGEDGEGLSVVLEPSVGDTSSTLAGLWSLEEVEVSLGGEASREAARAALRAEVGYGFPIGSGLVTPYSDVSLTEGGSSSVGLSLRYGLPSSLEVNFKAEQERSANGRVDYRVGLQLRTPL